MDPVVHPFFDPATFSWSYVVADPATRLCAVIDPVLDYDAESGAVGTASADRLAQCIDANRYCVSWILETHVHADHLSAGRYLKQRFVCAQHAIGACVVKVQAHFAARFGLDMPTDGRQFDRLLQADDRLKLGRVCGRVLPTPGHTPACVSYLFEDMAFVGDTLFMPDHGTARCDFPGGDARQLYRSVQRLYDLDEGTRLFMCHDYGPGGREFRCFTTVAEEKRDNLLLRNATSEADFVAARQVRDRGLAAPKLLIPAVRANIAGGVLPGWRLESRLAAMQQEAAA